MRRIIGLALLLVPGCLAGCSGQNAKWSVIDANYSGRPGLLIEVQTGGFSLYIGPDGQANATGEAESVEPLAPNGPAPAPPVEPSP